MINISSQQLAILENSQGRAVEHRLDTWLGQTLVGWSSVAAETRTKQISDAITKGKAIELREERDFALFCWLLFVVGPQRDGFFGAPEVRAVMAWLTPNRGAVLRELYRLAGLDIRVIVERLP